MDIILNNRPEHFDKESMSIRQLLKAKKFTFKLLVIKVNDVLVKKDAYDSTLVKDGDHVSVIHLVSGG